jgi:hypothetical protein
MFYHYYSIPTSCITLPSTFFVELVICHLKMNAFFTELNNRYKSLDFNREEVHIECIRELRESEFAMSMIGNRLIALHVIAGDIIRMSNNQEKLLFGVCTIVDFCRHGNDQMFLYHAYFSEVADISTIEEKFTNFFTDVSGKFTC